MLVKRVLLNLCFITDSLLYNTGSHQASYCLSVGHMGLQYHVTEEETKAKNSLLGVK